MIKLFYEKPINELFSLTDQCIIQELDRFVNIESIDSEKFSETIFQRLKIIAPKLRFEDLLPKPAIELRPGSSFPPQHMTSPNKNYPVVVITYCIPYIGNPELFSYQPNTYSHRTYNCFIEGSSLCFKIYTEYADINLTEEVKRKVLNESNSIIEWIRINLDNLNQDCLTYNVTLKPKIKNEIEKRKRINNELKNLGSDLNPLK